MGRPAVHTPDPLDKAPRASASGRTGATWAMKRDFLMIISAWPWRCTVTHATFSKVALPQFTQICTVDVSVPQATKGTQYLGALWFTRDALLEGEGTPGWRSQELAVVAVQCLGKPFRALFADRTLAVFHFADVVLWDTGDFREPFLGQPFPMPIGA